MSALAATQTFAKQNASTPASKLISPSALMAIKNLELRARIVVEGFWHGIHRSPYHGFPSSSPVSPVFARR
jgi:hypothetical protein